MKRIVMMFALAVLMVVALSLSAVFASAAPRLNGGDDKCRNSDHNHCVNNKDQGSVTNHGGQQEETNRPND